jgi:hypothetical protein
LSTAKTPGGKKPPWLEEFKRKTSIIDLLNMAWDTDCSCPVCAGLRATSGDLGTLFMPKEARKGKVLAT